MICSIRFWCLLPTAGEPRPSRTWIIMFSLLTAACFFQATGVVTRTPQIPGAQPRTKGTVQHWDHQRNARKDWKRERERETYKHSGKQSSKPCSVASLPPPAISDNHTFQPALGIKPCREMMLMNAATGPVMRAKQRNVESPKVLRSKKWITVSLFTIYTKRPAW